MFKGTRLKSWNWLWYCCSEQPQNCTDNLLATNWLQIQFPNLQTHSLNRTIEPRQINLTKWHPLSRLNPMYIIQCTLSSTKCFLVRLDAWMLQVKCYNLKVFAYDKTVCRSAKTIENLAIITWWARWIPLYNWVVVKRIWEFESGFRLRSDSLFTMACFQITTRNLRIDRAGRSANCYFKSQLGLTRFKRIRPIERRFALTTLRIAQWIAPNG